MLPSLKSSSLTVLSQKSGRSYHGRTQSATTRNRVLLKKGIFQDGLSKTNNSDLESLKSDASNQL